MKKCRRCSKPATLHITELRKGEAVEIHLCESCASEYLAQGEGSELTDPDAAELETEAEASDESETASGPTCPHCGITYREFRSQGRLGCPNDYDVFEAELGPLLENIHGTRQHRGKIPRRAPDSSRRQHELIRLRSDLKQAIEAEHYEEAAKLRDRIQEIESSLSGPSSTAEER